MGNDLESIIIEQFSPGVLFGVRVVSVSGMAVGTLLLSPAARRENSLGISDAG